MNDTDKLLMMKEREDEGNYVKKKKRFSMLQGHMPAR